MQVRSMVWALAAIGLLSVPAQAQWAIYAQASGSNLQVPNTTNVYGATFGFYDTKKAGPVLLGADFRGAMMGRGNTSGSYTDQALDMGLLGVRVAAAPGKLRLMPYVEALLGRGYWRGGEGITRQDSTHGMLQGVAGVDYRMSAHVDWRVVEFGYARVGAELGGFINPETLSTGIVLRLP